MKASTQVVSKKKLCFKCLRLITGLDISKIQKMQELWQTSSHASAYSAKSSSCNLKIIILYETVHNDTNATKDVFAFVDSVSSCSYITESLAEELKLKGEPDTLHLGTINGKRTLRCNRIEGASILSVNNGGIFKLCPFFSQMKKSLCASIFQAAVSRRTNT